MPSYFNKPDTCISDLHPHMKESLIAVPPFGVIFFNSYIRFDLCAKSYPSSMKAIIFTRSDPTILF